jgi:hypothetical protein
MAKSDDYPLSQQLHQTSEVAMQPATEKTSEITTENNEQFATGGRLALIMCAVLLAMFLVALVTLPYNSSILSKLYIYLRLTIY